MLEEKLADWHVICSLRMALSPLLIEIQNKTVISKCDEVKQNKDGSSPITDALESLEFSKLALSKLKSKLINRLGVSQDISTLEGDYSQKEHFDLLGFNWAPDAKQTRLSQVELENEDVQRKINRFNNWHKLTKKKDVKHFLISDAERLPSLTVALLKLEKIKIDTDALRGKQYSQNLKVLNQSLTKQLQDSCLLMYNTCVINRAVSSSNQRFCNNRDDIDNDKNKQNIIDCFDDFLFQFNMLKDATNSIVRSSAGLKFRVQVEAELKKFGEITASMKAAQRKRDRQDIIRRASKGRILKFTPMEKLIHFMVSEERRQQRFSFGIASINYTSMTPCEREIDTEVLPGANDKEFVNMVISSLFQY